MSQAKSALLDDVDNEEEYEDIDDDEDEYEYDYDDGRQRSQSSGEQYSNRMKIGFALLMIPSVMCMVYGNKKFRSESNVDWAALQKAGFPGLGRIPGFGPNGPGGGPDELPEHLRRVYDHHRRGRRNRQVHDAPEDSVPDGFDENFEDQMEGLESQNAEKNEIDGSNGETQSPSETQETSTENPDNKMEIDLDPPKSANEPEPESNPPDPPNSNDDDDDADMDYGESPDPYLPEYGHRGFGGHGGFGGLGGLGGMPFGGFGGGHHHSTWDPDPHLEEDTEEPYYRRRKKRKKEAEKKPPEPGYKVILFWKPESLKDNFIDIGTTAFEDSKCIEKRCVITTDRNYLPIADAVVFSERDDFTDLPTHRPKEQKWIFQSTKPSNTTAHGLHKLGRLINWTWTYAKDSDIIYKLHRLKSISAADLVQLQLMFNVFDVWRRKKKMALTVSNVELRKDQAALIADLQKVIDLDTYGDFGDKSCPDKRDCLKDLEHEYLFVIIFQDKYCHSFLSQEIYHALHHNMVPVIVGKGNYSDITPPKSVILASSFNTAKDLGDYLNGIGSDYNLYKVFLEWKKRFHFVYQRDDLCKLCSLLNQKGVKASTYNDVAEWWRVRSCKV